MDTSDCDGLFICVKSGFKSNKRGYFEIDFVVAIFQGRFTEIENLQVLTWKKNWMKVDG